MTLRVLLDATALPEDRGGVGRYVDGLVGALDRDDTCQLIVVCQARDVALFTGLAAHSEVVGIPRRWSSTFARLIWEQLRLPGLARRLGAEVLHCPHYTMPIVSSRPVIVTFHDATFFSDPTVHTRVKRVFFRSWILFSNRRAAAIVVPSVATRSEIARFVPPRNTPVIVAYHGVDTSVFRPPDPAAVREIHDLVGDENWIAFLGTLEPRKNLSALVGAYAALSREATHAPPVLTLAGGVGWDHDLDAAVQQVRPPGRVVRLGFLPVALLPGFLGGSRLVVYPSLGEGFGLPVLEALASGAAVLTTSRLALPEVGGDAVAYSEPDAGSLKQAMNTLLDDDERIAALRRGSVDRAALFSWAASATRHLEAYRMAADA